MSEATILIVEPDLLVRHPLAQYLRDCGYRVLEATRPAEARQLLDEPVLPVDIVLTAVDTPDESGLALASWIQQAYPTIRVILAGTMIQSVEKASELCEQSHVAKPYGHQDVLDLIRRLHRVRDRSKAQVSLSLRS